MVDLVGAVLPELLHQVLPASEALLCTLGQQVSRARAYGIPLLGCHLCEVASDLLGTGTEVQTPVCDASTAEEILG